jgi:hypothetical protein
MDTELLKRLDALSAKLGVAANALWGSYMKQAILNGWECFAFGVFFLAAMLLFWKISWDSKGNNEKLDRCALAFIAGTGALVIAGLFFFNSADYLFNPTVWAFKSVMADIH